MSLLILLELISHDDRDSILSSCSDLIPILQQEPAPILELVNVLIRPESFTFARVLAIEPAVDFVAGLSSSSAPVNFIALSLLRKAILNESDADIVAGRPEAVAALIRLWLCTPDIGVCERARKVLLGLLKASKQGSSHSVSFHQSLMWRRVFRDRDIYGLIFSICSLKTVGNPDQPSKRAKTIAQGRLFDLLVNLIDSEPIRTSQLLEVENKYGVKDGGLLEFAALHMVDYEHDPLMHVSLVEFFTNLLRTRSSAALDFLVKTNLHDSTTLYYNNLELGPMARSALSNFDVIYPQVAEYIAVYCSNFEAHLLGNRRFVDRLISCLHEVAEAAASMPQRFGFAPRDLKILASLPRAVLLPRNSSLTPLFNVVPDLNLNDANIYKTLATIFRGTVKPNLQDRSRSIENSAGRALYFLYTKKFPLLWKIVCRDANVVALKELALAAIELIKTVINANWESLPTEIIRSSLDWPTLPTEQELASECGFAGELLPSSGFLAILDSRSYQEVVTYLCSAPSTFTSLGGGMGDAESAAYQVAVAKYDVMMIFRQKLRDVVQTRPEMQNVLTTLGERLAQGPTGGSSDVGGRIDTLEL